MNKGKKQKEYDRQVLRLLKLLAKNLTSGFRVRMEDKAYIVTKNAREYRFARQLVEEQMKSLYVKLAKNRMSITQLGRDKLKFLLSPEINHSSNIIETQITFHNERQTVSLNSAESPLCRLYFRKDKNGCRFISQDEFNAGERLRQDFEKGQLQPKISASLETKLGGGRRKDASDISDFALDARLRVNKALETLGPEFDGVLLDICCFLKGLELVERERRWPPRSAKLMLKTGLSILARHYGIGMTNSGSQNRNHFWGEPDYRPTLA